MSKASSSSSAASAAAAAASAAAVSEQAVAGEAVVAASAAAVSEQAVADGKQELETAPTTDGKRKRDDLTCSLDVDIASIITMIINGDGRLFYIMPHASKLKILEAMVRLPDTKDPDSYMEKLAVMIMCTSGSFRELSDTIGLDGIETFGFNLLHLLKCEHDTNLMTELGRHVDSGIERPSDPQAIAIARRLASDGYCFAIYVYKRSILIRSKYLHILHAIMADDARTIAGCIHSDTVNDTLQFIDPFLLFERDTAAHIAARFGRHRVYDWLLKNGADPNVENVLGETPAELHAANGGSRGIKAARKE